MIVREAWPLELCPLGWVWKGLRLGLRMEVAGLLDSLSLSEFLFDFVKHSTFLKSEVCYLEDAIALFGLLSQSSLVLFIGGLDEQPWLFCHTSWILAELLYKEINFFAVH